MKAAYLSFITILLGFILIISLLILVKVQGHYENLSFAVDHALQITFEDFKAENKAALEFTEVYDKFEYYFQENLNSNGVYTINVMGFNSDPWLFRVQVISRFESFDNLFHTISVDRTIIMEGE